MITLYHAAGTRSSRIVWLLEELELPYQVEKVAFVPPVRPFAQATPSGKLPALRDGDLLMFESGAILEYVLERHGGGRLAPPPGTPERGLFLQWIHFAEATVFPPLANLAWHTFFKKDTDQVPTVMADSRDAAAAALDVLERGLGENDYLLGREFSGADVMMGYTLQAAQWLGALTERHEAVGRYLARLQARPAFHKAMGS